MTTDVLEIRLGNHSLKTRRESIICPRYKISKICKVDDESSTLCEFHSAKPARTRKDKMRIIEEPTYDSPDRAAMAAANIILRLSRKVKHGYGGIPQPNNIEYGMAIYKKNGTNIYCLAEAREGYETAIDVDDGIKHPQYSFIAHVHSHPVHMPNQYRQVFSLSDYILSYRGVLEESGILSGNQYISYLVARLKNSPWSLAAFVQCKTSTQRRCPITNKRGHTFQYHNGDEIWILQNCWNGSTLDTIDKDCPHMLCNDGTTMPFDKGILMRFTPPQVSIHSNHLINISQRGFTFHEFNEEYNIPPSTSWINSSAVLLPMFNNETYTAVNNSRINKKVNVIITEHKCREIFRRYVEVADVNTQLSLNFRKIQYPYVSIDEGMI
jgi:hypothetical protein